MADWIERVLARKRVVRGRIISEEPDEKLVWGVKFAIVMIGCLSAIEVAHIAFLQRWNSEVFAAITGLSGTVIGVFFGHRSS